jgi:hypothetical protein
MPKTFRIRTCYSSETYVSFIERTMLKAKRKKFVSHLDSCNVCQQAIRVATKTRRG